MHSGYIYSSGQSTDPPASELFMAQSRSSCHSVFPAGWGNGGKGGGSGGAAGPGPGGQSSHVSGASYNFVPPTSIWVKGRTFSLSQCQLVIRLNASPLTQYDRSPFPHRLTPFSSSACR